MKKLALIAAIGLASSLSHAASFTFTGLSGISGNSYSATNGGITVTVAAASGNLGYFSADGFGVKDGFFDGQAMGDGESLIVSFSEAVTIDSLRLRQWELADRVQLVSAGGNLTLDAETAPFDSNETFSLASLGAISSFTLTGDTFGTQALLAALNDVQQVQEVPVPAAAWLFGSALVGLAGLRRRKAA